MIKKEILAGFILLLCFSNIAAFAISSDYWSGNPLKLAPGESKEFSLILQNVAGTSDIKLKITVVEGKNVLQLMDSKTLYTVPAGEKINVNFRATMPIDAKSGDRYTAKIDFAEVKDTSQGEFGFGTAIGQNFEIITLPEKTPFNRTIIIYFIGGIAVLLIVILTLKKVMKGKSHKRKR